MPQERMCRNMSGRRIDRWQGEQVRTLPSLGHQHLPSTPLRELAAYGRFILANTEQLHAKIKLMSSRIRDLEDALQELHSGHHLLHKDLLDIKKSADLFGVDPSQAQSSGGDRRNDAQHGLVNPLSPPVLSDVSPTLSPNQGSNLIIAIAETKSFTSRQWPPRRLRHSTRYSRNQQEVPSSEHPERRPESDPTQTHIGPTSTSERGPVSLRASSRTCSLAVRLSSLPSFHVRFGSPCCSASSRRII